MRHGNFQIEVIAFIRAAQVEIEDKKMERY